jgi:hypothetical protein
MRLKSILVTAAAASLASAPAVAQGADRTAAPVAGESALGFADSATQLIVLALVAAAIIVGIEVFGDDEPASP